MLVFMIVPVVLAALWTNVLAQSDSDDPEVVITFFWRDGCSHCAEEKPFLLELADKYPQIVLKGYEVYTNLENREYFFAIGENIGFEANAVPVTIIGDHVWIGYGETVGEEIEAAVAACLDSGCVDPAIVNNIDTSNTDVSFGVSEPEVIEEENSSFPVWIITVLLLVVFSYFVGRTKAKSKTKKKSAK